MESENLKKYQNRLLVSDLIYDVLNKKISVQTALSKFPSDRNDINLKCAFDAILHLEADEDVRNNDSEYAMLQDETLRFIAECFKDNQTLPKNMIKNYLNEHDSDLTGEYLPFIKSVLKNFKRMINF
ncbi:MAG: hypothetical protein IJ003_06120 [Candidatus Gastranaerophilales bacterium]|nr:hypothetical protein [Candidatus Gastranaerophilales bacterium]